MLFPIGTAVRISQTGQRVYRHTSSNPYNLVGKVIGYDVEAYLSYKVRWSNGYFNTYKENQLMSGVLPSTEEMYESVMG